VPSGSPLSTGVPQSIIDALNNLQAAQDALHSSNGAKAVTAATLTQAQTADQSAATAVASALAAQQAAYTAAAGVFSSVYTNPNA
jgi:hypothetical protein